MLLFLIGESANYRRSGEVGMEFKKSRDTLRVIPT
jgi:hypothetical protein